MITNVVVVQCGCPHYTNLFSELQKHKRSVLMQKSRYHDKKSNQSFLHLATVFPMGLSTRNTKYFIIIMFFLIFGDGNWRQAEAWIVLLAGAVEVNALAQGPLRRFTQWLWISWFLLNARSREFDHHGMKKQSPASSLYYCVVCLFIQKMPVMAGQGLKWSLAYFTTVEERQNIKMPTRVKQLAYKTTNLVINNNIHAHPYERKVNNKRPYFEMTVHKKKN